MCGIAGFVGQREIDRNTIDLTLNLMSRRGPNHCDVYEHVSGSGRRVYLLHSRLSVIDPDARSNQPFRIDQHVMAFNGEIYNYVELADNLKGTRRTDGDTEVLLQTLIDYPDALDRLDGMWAFAWFNETSGTLKLCRDRFGEKPLYVAKTDAGVYFGSEIKFILQLMNRTPSVNTNHLFRYLINGYRSLFKTHDTFLNDIRHVPAASVITIDADGKINESKYWSPQVCPEDSMDMQSCVRMTQAALIQSVERRLRADVPLAFCLSGGIDSNALVAIAKRVCGYDVHGFTIVNDDPRYDERPMVRHAVEQLNLRHQSVPVTADDFLERLDRLIAYHDGPVCTMTYYAHHLLLQAIANAGYRVSVSGTGADELFSGYFDHHNAYLYQAHKTNTGYKTARANWERYIQPIVRNPRLRDADLFIGSPDCRDYIYLNADEFRQVLHTQWNEPFQETHYTDDLLRNRMLNELFQETAPPILHADDLNAMYHSVENRSPYLDRSLFEVAASIPTRHLIQHGSAKAVLREAVREWVPHEILDNRTKIGFNVSINSLLDLNAPATRAWLTADGPINAYIDRDVISTWFDQPDIPNSIGKFLFNFINVKLFLDQLEG